MNDQLVDHPRCRDGRGYLGGAGRARHEIGGVDLMRDLVSAINSLTSRPSYGTPRERFEKRCFPMSGGCIGFKGFHDKDGYPRFTFAGQQRPASHAALAIAGVSVQNGDQANHHCDNPACVNASHLFIGSQDDNVKDMMSKDRHALGERHTISILSDDAVRDIRHNCTKRGQPKMFAAKYDVSISTIRAARCGQNWSHVK